MVEFLASLDWDALRNWLATIGGLAALFIAANTYRRNIKFKREEQARLVYSRLTHVEFHDPGTEFPMLPNEAKIGTMSSGTTIVMPSDPNEKAHNLALVPVIQVTAIVHNGSKELIGPVKVQMVNAGLDKIWDTFSIQVDAVEPESDYVVDFVWPNDVHPGQPGLATTLLFRDASGQWWRRHKAEPIERVHDDPENTRYTPTERAQWAAVAAAMGLEPSQEPQPPRRVRWHRYWRKRAGKTPVP
jgi:hypothetical protein